MTIDVSDPQVGKQPGMEDGGIWEGEELRLVQEDGSRGSYGVFASTMRLPGRHVPPTVTAAGVHVRAMQTAREQLGRDIDARKAELAQLVEELAQESDLDGAAEKLARFKSRTELLEARIPPADAAVAASWDALYGAIESEKEPWNGYLHARGAEVVVALQDTGVEGWAAWIRRLCHGLGAAETVLVLLREARLIDGLLVRIEIRSIDAADFATNFARGQRDQTVAAYLQGSDMGPEGRRFGLSELGEAYRDAIAKP
jgi:hypothetical protein